MKLEHLRKYFQIIAGNRIVQHFLFWGLSYFILLNFFSSSNKVEKIDFIYTFLFHISLVAAVYVNIWLLIPMFMTKRRYMYYLLSVLALLFLSAFINQLTFNKLVDLILPDYYFISFYELDDILKFIFIYLALSSLLKLSKGWFMLMETNRRMLLIEKEKTETELKALKSQVNPHFLFNSLNNIYSLALNRSESTPEVILKLSGLMRYMLYESNESLVPLRKELIYLENYIELQKIRSDHQASVSYEIHGEINDQKIAPLLFLPFVENSFKHGIKGETEGVFVNVRMEVGEDYVHFTAENNMGKIDSIEKDSESGIGLQNARRRLELIYPNRHSLEIMENESNFTVKLKLQLT